VVFRAAAAATLPAAFIVAQYGAAIGMVLPKILRQRPPASTADRLQMERRAPVLFYFEL